MNPLTTERLKDALGLLSQLLEAENAEPEHLVIIGGSALIALDLVTRSTRDVDIMAYVDPEKGLVDPRPMSEALQRAARKVAMELGLEGKWLNTGPADQLRTGLPEGFLSNWDDLKALAPTDEEMLAAARWVLTQDAGEVFPMIVNQTLQELGHGHLVDHL